MFGGEENSPYRLESKYLVPTYAGDGQNKNLQGCTIQRAAAPHSTSVTMGTHFLHSPQSGAHGHFKHPEPTMSF